MSASTCHKRHEGAWASNLVLGLLLLAAEFVRVSERVSAEPVCLALDEGGSITAAGPGNSLAGSLTHLWEQWTGSVSTTLPRDPPLDNGEHQGYG